MDLMGYFSDLCIQSPQKTPGEHLNFLCQISGCSGPVWISIGGFSRFGCQEFSGRKIPGNTREGTRPPASGNGHFCHHSGKAVSECVFGGIPLLFFRVFRG